MSTTERRVVERNPMNEPDFDLAEEEFHTLFDQVVEFTTLMLKDKPRSIMPYLTVFTTNKENKRGTIVIAMDVDFNDTEEKHKLLENVGAKLAKDKEVVLAAVLISEAWTSRAAIEEDVQPRYASDKREAIVIAGMSIDKKYSRMLSQPVLRYNEGLMADGQPNMDSRKEGHSAEFPLLHPFFGGHIEQWRKQLNITPW